MLHTLNGFLCAAIGFSLLDILNRDERLAFKLSPVYLAVVAFCFSMTIGVLWGVLRVLYGPDVPAGHAEGPGGDPLQLAGTVRLVSLSTM